MSVNKIIYCGVWVHLFCEYSKVPFAILHEILKSYTAQYAYHDVLNFMNYDILARYDKFKKSVWTWTAYLY